MPKIEEKIYCIYQREWEILLAKAGMEKTFGLVFPKKEREKAEVVQTLYQMVKKGMLTPEGDSLEITYDYKELLSKVRQAGAAFHFMQRQEKEWEHGFAYMGENFTVFTCSGTRKEAFEVRLIPRENWAGYLWEKGVFPSYRTEAGTVKKEEISITQTESQEFMLVEEVTAILAKMDLISRKETGWIVFLEEGGKQFLFWKNETVHKVPYTMEGFQKMLEEEFLE